MVRIPSAESPASDFFPIPGIFLTGSGSRNS